MVKKFLLAVTLALTLAPAASYAQVVVRVAPPAPIVERRPPPPDREAVWIARITSGSADAGIIRPATGSTG